MSSTNHKDKFKRGGVAAVEDCQNVLRFDDSLWTILMHVRARSFQGDSLDSHSGPTFRKGFISLRMKVLICIVSAWLHAGVTHTHI